jgi:anti-anti-sigma regulatory factor
MSILARHFNKGALSMRQTNTSPSTLARSKPGSRVSELARFASRINRGMKVDVEQDIVIITPSEGLGALRYEALHLEVGRVNDLLRHGGFRKLLIDLSERRRIESVILMALVGFCRSIPGQAAFCGVSEEIRQSMQTANLIDLWPVYEGRSEAIEVLIASDSNLPARRAGGTDV